MFKSAQTVLSAAELRDLGARIQERKKQLKAMGTPRLGQTTGPRRGATAAV